MRHIPRSLTNSLRQLIGLPAAQVWRLGLGTALSLSLAGATLGTAHAQDGIRVTIEAEVLDDLMQDERWALIDAQNFAKKGQHARAAIEFQKFAQQYDASILWSYAVYNEAFYLMKDGKTESGKGRLLELIEIDPQAPEIPEAKLLLGKAHLSTGETDEALVWYRRVLNEHPKSSARVPAIIGADNAIRKIGAEKQQKPEDIQKARLSVLSGIAENILIDYRNAAALQDGLTRLRDLSIASGQLNQALALVEGLNKAKGKSRSFDIQRFSSDTRKRVMWAAWDVGEGGLADKVASSEWSNSVDRFVSKTRMRYDWLTRTIAKPKAVAELRGLGESELRDLLKADVDATIESLAAWLEEKPNHKRSREVALWLVDRYHESGKNSLAWDTYMHGRTQLSGRDAISYHSKAMKAQVSGSLARSRALGAMPDSLDRDRAQLTMLSSELRGASNPQALAAEALSVADGLIESDPERANEYKYAQARIYEAPLAKWDEAIRLYAEIHQPPKTDFAIANCHVNAGRAREAIAVLEGIYIGNRKSDSGASAKFKIGELV